MHMSISACLCHSRVCACAMQPVNTELAETLNRFLVPDFVVCTGEGRLVSIQSSSFEDFDAERRKVRVWCHVCTCVCVAVAARVCLCVRVYAPTYSRLSVVPVKHMSLSNSIDPVTMHACVCVCVSWVHAGYQHS